MFINPPPVDAAVDAMYERDRTQEGFVMNLTRLWAWRPKVTESFARLRNILMAQSSLLPRERSVVVCASASALGDAYCALAWGAKLALQSTPSTAAAVLGAAERAELTPRERALAQWARKVVHAPNSTTPADVATLREAGLSEQEIFDATVLVAFRLAFSTVNDALGARPDREIAERAPDVVRRSVTYGREIAQANSPS